MEPLVSIIVPTYNRHELLLNRCLPSIFRQTYPKIEIIVVSDGPDNWLREYFAEKNIPNLKHLIYSNCLSIIKLNEITHYCINKKIRIQILN